MMFNPYGMAAQTAFLVWMQAETGANLDAGSMVELVHTAAVETLHGRSL